MSVFEVKPAVSGDIARMMVLDHSALSDYVWQMEMHTDTKQVTVIFNEVRLPRSITVEYPRDPYGLADEWLKKDLVLAAFEQGEPVGYACAVEEHPSSIVVVTDLVVAPIHRRRGVGSELLTRIQVWALERGARRAVLEMQSKNSPYIRLAQKFGYEFCGYNDQYYPTQDVALFFGRALR